jgi:translocation and assembly module TamA
VNFFFLLFLLYIPLVSHAYDELCPAVRIKYLQKLKLDENEKRLLCGDKEVGAYKNIPTYQARYFLQGFLQSRGYQRPVLKIENAVLFADPGSKARVKKVRLEVKDPELKDEVQQELRRLYNKKVLSTSTLNSIEAEGIASIRNRGFPCAKITSVANIDDNIVTLNADRLYFHKFGNIDKEPIEGLRANALDRFYPFSADDDFNADLLRLTEKRLTRSEVVQGTYFLERCEGKEFDLKQNFIIGPPRTLRYGAGATTEQGPMVRLRWSHNRFHSMASQLSATAEASFRIQSVSLLADSFLWHNEPRRSILSQAEIIHEDQVKYEQLVYRVRPLMKWTRDAEGFHKTYTLGPSYEGGTYHSSDNADTRSFSTGIIEGNLQWMSHRYEMFDILPQEGELYTFRFDFRHPGLGFEVPLLKMETSAVRAERLTNWGRGTVIGAVRLNAGTSWLNTDKISVESLPPTVKFFGGGSDDIRGFYLSSLPKNNGTGALTRTVAKFELRRTYLFIPSLEAFAFLDGGYFSEEPWQIDTPLYYSPGAGLRWLSPIGMVQGFWARGLSSDPYRDSGNLFYVGIGGSF